MTADTSDLQTAADPIAADARATFSLKEALAGGKRKTRKVLVFTDEVAVEAFTSTEGERVVTEGRLGDESLEPEVRARLVERLEQLAPKLEELRTEMLASALSVHMSSVPDVVMEAGRRAARKAYAVDGRIPEEKLEDANALQQRYVLGRVITKVVRSDGAEATFDRDEIADDLRTALPIPQWTRIVMAYNEIVFTDAVGAQATLEPGF